MFFTLRNPNWRTQLGSQLSGLPLSILVLLLLLLFTYGIFVRAPYAGFYFDPNDGRILKVFTNLPSASPSLQDGDALVKIGPVLWEDFQRNRKLAFFENIKPGQLVEISLDRNGARLTIPWKMPGFNPSEFNERLINIWWLAYVYWFFGSATQLILRPMKTRWRLLIAANYLTSLWLIFGSMSAWHLWYSSILLHAVTWLILPVYLHLHWVFPKPLRPVPKPAVLLFYLACLLLAIGEILQLLPRSLYSLAFLVALAGSTILQGVHFIFRPDQRREVGFLAISILLVVTPLITLSISGLSSTFPRLAPLTFLALPLMPLAYFYVVYRQQMGGLELRANRIISIYAFLILLGVLLLMISAPIIVLPISQEVFFFFVVMIALLAALVSALVFPRFQAFVEQRFLGIQLPYQNLQESYSARIVASASMPGLLKLLDEQVFPSLLVRQYSFIQVFNGHPKTLLSKRLGTDQLLLEQDIPGLISHAGKYLPLIPSSSPERSSWIRLVLPLKIGEELIGLWLFGQRDPDDIYPHSEILILQSIANQTAIALSNILHAEQLRKMYQLDIERYEKERLRLALDLHDSILNQLAVLRTNLEDNQLSPKFSSAYEELTRRLREIVSDLRPPMLMYGLKPAIEELADNLMQRSGDRVRITVDVQAGQERVPQNIEQHLFRIVQEACENALRHSHAGQIRISGTLELHRIDLKIEDNGKGFEIGEQLELGTLLANNHFGLAGIVERVNLIGAEIRPRSTPQTGTMIQVIWNHNPQEE